MLYPRSLLDFCSQTRGVPGPESIHSRHVGIDRTQSKTSPALLARLVSRRTGAHVCFRRNGPATKGDGRLVDLGHDMQSDELAANRILAHWVQDPSSGTRKHVLLAGQHLRLWRISRIDTSSGLVHSQAEYSHLQAPQDPRRPGEKSRALLFRAQELSVPVGWQ